MKRLKWLIAMAIAVALSSKTAEAQSDPTAFWQRTNAGLMRALNDPTTNQRVFGIWLKLVRETGRMFPVMPAQQYTLGQALPTGLILLDLSIAGDYDEEVTAFTLAHEYGHQILGHPQLSVSQVGRWLAAVGGTSQEDAADRWSGRFLRRAGYDIEPVLSFLCELPGGGRGDSHSSGPRRAANVARAYGGAVEVPCDAEEEDDEGEGGYRRPGVQVATYCHTRIGSCQLMNQVAVGTSCICVTAYGNVAGIAGN